jgi:iron-sulfur cluster assembly accessory protein
MIQLSQSAVSEILRQRTKRQNSGLLLRLAVQSGGCLDAAYVIDFDITAQAQDQIYECGSIQVVVDSQSHSYLDGLVIDYTEDMMGGGFRFHNPNAVRSCGCGNSFEMSTIDSVG